MGNITSIHDTFIRAIMADKEIAVDYFKASLPEYVLDKLDFSTLIQLPDTYISGELRKTVSDIIYSCQRKDGRGEVRISLLLEHKSYIDKYTPIQIGSYIFSGLLKQVENEKRISLIIPILLYHGGDKWEYCTLEDLFKDADPITELPEWRKYIPNFHYLYHNLGEVPDEQLEILSNNFLKASLLTLKHSFEKEWLEANAVKLLVWTENVVENLQRGFVVYLLDRSKLKRNKMIKIMEGLPLSVKRTVGSTIDNLLEEGRRENAEKVVRNMIRKGYSDAQICEVLEVIPDYVARIRMEINAGK